MRVSRRKSNYVILLLLLALAGVSGTGFVFLSQPSYPPSDIFIMETAGDPDSMDPHVNDDIYGARVLFNVYETLYTYPWGSATTESAVPLLAALAPATSTDGLQYNISLRQEVIFHDGTPFNASCVKWNIERAAKMFDVNGPAWMIIEPLKGGGTLKNEAYVSGTSSPEFAAAFDDWQANSSALVVLDAYTIQFNLEYLFAPFIAAMTHSVGSMISPTYVLTHTDNDTGAMESHWGVDHGQTSTFMETHACGTGPYLLEEWRPNEFLKLELFEDYWRMDVAELVIAPPEYAGHIETVLVRVNEDVTGRKLNLRTGLADYVDWPITNADEIWVNDTAGSMDPNIEVRTDGLIYSMMAFTFNFNRVNITRQGNETEVQSPFVYRELRKCFAYAFNYDEAIDTIVRGWGVQARGFIPQGMFGQNSAYWPEHYDIDEAVDWWNQAMLQPGFVETINNMSGYIDLYYNSGSVIREESFLLMRDGLASVMGNPATNLTGISPVPEVRVNGLTRQNYLNKVDNGEQPIWLTSWDPDYADPHNYALTFAHSQGTYMSVSSYHNSTLDEWIVNASESADPAQRLELYNKIQEQVSFDQPSIYMYQPRQFIVHRAWLKGRGLNFNPMHDFYVYETY
ncbi:MAG: ABC transporter substrate-binding protein, partial [Candidatus Thorarchaeota archaeon]